ncbi:MAG TPA: DUF1801 domain-containing protein [Flavisolibacter sp.]
MKNRFQDVDFRNVNDFLDYLPAQDLKIVGHLRELIFSCIPDAKEKLAYNVPFYYRHSRLCFIWPGCIAWGKTDRKGVDFGFCRGNLLPDASQLEKGNRKEVYIMTLHHYRDIRPDVIRQLLYDAVIVDEELASMRRRKIS